MKVECYDREGAEAYELVVKQVLQDLQLGRAIEDLQIFADPREPVFIIVVKFAKAASPVYLEDMAIPEYDKEENKLHLRITDETYLPQLLEKLWRLEGREKIQQPTRFEIIIENPTVKLEGLIVHDPQETLRKKIYDAIFRIIPEGFRVIRDISTDNIIAMVCTDEILQEEWIKKADNMIKKVGAERRW
ncbi:methanogenesis marker 17 protein [Methanothermobacter tenebrarum]|uniref:Methanogenesis marker 17 protein n=1 Tax=Methanothermobacter tenebrarum TaxID=680118 RepID=A0A328PBM9_9EURY|nr:methanogenesis marker 17 protein [Methanothermobacter tenebrarum]MBC7100545.1 methanogenesis marker 17 protein [Methanobacteriales archaeon]NPV64202.1 methanogenesis marker 17 protein [Methanobacteriaceae archaeon]RAO79819.1 methanogenesis marker 17 protein [Methanothermobacter tenebrarum]